MFKSFIKILVFSAFFPMILTAITQKDYHSEELLLENVFKELPGSPEGHWNLINLTALKEIIKMTQPSSILEIGFNVGHSAMMWLNFSQATLISVDIGKHPNTSYAANVVGQNFPNRFEYIESDSKLVYPLLQDRKFDLIFIDGSHQYEDCLNDLYLAKRLNIQNIVVDDIGLKHVTKAVQEFSKREFLVLIKRWKVKTWGLALYRLEFNREKFPFKKMSKH